MPALGWNADHKRHPRGASDVILERLDISSVTIGHGKSNTLIAIHERVDLRGTLQESGGLVNDRVS